MEYLFICKGNVGRSQIAEGLCKKIYPDKQVASAGTKISGPEQPIGELMPHIKEVLDVMQEEGIDASGFVRKQLTEEMLANTDKAIAIIEDSEELPEFLQSSPKLTRWNVSDPKGKDLEFTRKVKDTVKEYIEKL